MCDCMIVIIDVVFIPSENFIIIFLGDNINEELECADSEQQQQQEEDEDTTDDTTDTDRLFIL